MPDETTDLFSSIDMPEGEAPAIAEPTPTPEPAPAPVEVAEPTTAAAAPPVPASAAVATPPTPEPAAAQPERSVPLAVLLEERRQAREDYAKLQARLEQLERPKEVAAPEMPTPDFLDDPKAYVDAKAEQINAALKKLETQGTERLATVERSAADMALDRGIIAAQEQFVAKTPDFQDALVHARNGRIAFLQAMNPSIEQAQIVNAVTHEERMFAAHCLRQNVNPAEQVYRLAQSMGYTPRQAAQAAAAVASGTAPGDKVVPPDMTLNSTPGQAPQGDVDEGDAPDMLAQAQAERFSRKRA